MPKLNINFNDVSETFEPIPPGVYVASILNAPSLEPTKAGDSNKLVVEMQIEDVVNLVQDDVDPSKVVGRRITDQISVKMLSKLKQLGMSAGVEFDEQGDYDTDELEGKHVKIKVTARSYNDPATGETRHGDRVSAYLFEKD